MLRIPSSSNFTIYYNLLKMKHVIMGFTDKRKNQKRYIKLRKKLNAN